MSTWWLTAYGPMSIWKVMIKISKRNVVCTGKYGKDPRQAALHEYLVAHSVRANEHLEGLRLTQLKHPRAGMASPQDSIAILQMMVHLTQARKVIEIGVFTGVQCFVLFNDNVLDVCLLVSHRNHSHVAC
jgi:hypothetical protein